MICLDQDHQSLLIRSFLVVLICLVLSVLSTIEKFSVSLSLYVYWIEIFLVLFFGIEYILRLWSAGCRSKYMGVSGRLRFARKPIALVGKSVDRSIRWTKIMFLSIIVDLFVVVASTLLITLAADRQAFAASAIRGVRFLQILRVLHVDRHGGTWRLLGSVVYIHRQVRRVDVPFSFSFPLIFFALGINHHVIYWLFSIDLLQLFGLYRWKRWKSSRRTCCERKWKSFWILCWRTLVSPFTRRISINLLPYHFVQVGCHYNHNDWVCARCADFSLSLRIFLYLSWLDMGTFILWHGNDEWLSSLFLNNEKCHLGLEKSSLLFLPSLLFHSLHYQRWEHFIPLRFPSIPSLQGILGSGFALKVQQKQRQKHFSRQIPAAATLIQAAWRVYASSPNSSCTATWNIYLHANDPRLSNTGSTSGTATAGSGQKSFSNHHQSFSGKWTSRLKSSWWRRSFPLE